MVQLMDEGRSLTDEELITCANAGVDAAYRELCARHSKMAFAVIYRILKHREDAEDAMQETLLRVYLHLRSFDGRAKFSTWFTRIAINSALMAIRKKGAHPTQSLDELTSGDSGRSHWLTSSLPSPETQLVEREMSCRLQQAVDRLPTILRSVTALRHTEDLSVAEVADLTGISLAAAKSRLLRGRERLSITMRDRRIRL